MVWLNVTVYTESLKNVEIRYGVSVLLVFCRGKRPFRGLAITAHAFYISFGISLVLKNILVFMEGVRHL